ncbi:hypothetical protein FQA47_021548 [Oryzias melastigma]|uniref:Uncharacterized protein n=1 Tax=Oryzias melastigma TaxID=30732 RepID=A0A834BMC7_ORYME|nr:hypothetical protein FQA47_021548 [Oryzias melastigma]
MRLCPGLLQVSAHQSHVTGPRVLSSVVFAVVGYLYLQPQSSSVAVNRLGGATFGAVGFVCLQLRAAVSESRAASRHTTI